jgi:hypothetical protein
MIPTIRQDLRRLRTFRNRNRNPTRNRLALAAASPRRVIPWFELPFQVYVELVPELDGAKGN